MSKKRRRRIYKTDFERYEVKRKSLLQRYKNGEHIPPEEIALAVLTIFLPLMEDNIEEESWSICFDDEQSKQIVKEIKSDVQMFLLKYRYTLEQKAKEDKLVKYNCLLSVDCEQVAKAIIEGDNIQNLRFQKT